MEFAVTRLLPNICTDKLEETRDFYARLLGFIVGFEHRGWYVQMASPADPKLQIGIMRHDHEFTPKELVADPNGLLVHLFAFP